MATTKNQPFLKRLGFACGGLTAALRSENSFRFHVLAAVVVLAALVWLRPAPIWWGVMLLTVMAVLALELVNTAIEKLADHLHPETHPQIKLVKDCAAAAVLIASLCALGVAAALVVATVSGSP
jgi:diacylglycerol kinase (ATP)